MNPLNTPHDRQTIIDTLKQLRQLHDTHCKAVKAVRSKRILADATPAALTNSASVDCCPEYVLSFRILVEPPQPESANLFSSFARRLAETFQLECGEISFSPANSRLLVPLAYAAALEENQLMSGDWSSRPPISIVPLGALDKLRTSSEMPAPLTFCIRPEASGGSAEVTLNRFRLDIFDRPPISRSTPLSHERYSTYQNAVFLLRNLFTLTKDADTDNLHASAARFPNEEDDHHARLLYEKTRWLILNPAYVRKLFARRRWRTLAVNIYRAAKHLAKNPRVLFVGGPQNEANLFAGMIARWLLIRQGKSMGGGRRLLQFADVQAFNNYQIDEVLDSVIIFRNFFRLFAPLRDTSQEDVYRKAIEETLPKCIRCLEENQCYLIVTCPDVSELPAKLASLTMPPVGVTRTVGEIQEAISQIGVDWTKEKLGHCCFTLTDECRQSLSEMLKSVNSSHAESVQPHPRRKRSRE